MKPFKRRRRGGLAATFEIGEAHLIANLAGQVIELLRDRNGAPESTADPLAAEFGFGGPSLAPEDPVLQRLLPDAYRDDADDASEFRRYTERSLTNHKVENCTAVIDSLIDGGLDLGQLPDVDSGERIDVELDEGGTQAWLRALTDIRLSIAVRLGIETDEDSALIALSDDEATLAMHDIYDWLGYVQETLIAALD